MNSNLYYQLQILTSYLFTVFRYFMIITSLQTLRDQKINMQYILNKLLNLFTQKKHKFITIDISL